MHTADTACCEYADTGHSSNDHRCSDGRRPVLLARYDERQIAATTLVYVLTLLPKMLNVFSFQSDFQPATADGNCCWDGATCTHRVFDHHRCFDISRVGHAVTDDG